MPLRDCEECGASFDPNGPEKRKIGGKIIHCASCSEETTVRYLGVAANGGKVAGVEVLKFKSTEDREAYRKWRNRQAGMDRGKSCQLGNNFPPPNVSVELVSEFGGNENHKGRA